MDTTPTVKRSKLFMYKLCRFWIWEAVGKQVDEAFEKHNPSTWAFIVTCIMFVPLNLVRILQYEWLAVSCLWKTEHDTASQLAHLMKLSGVKIPAEFYEDKEVGNG